MSDATKLPADQQAAAMVSISAEGLPQAIERQAAAGELLIVRGIKNHVQGYHTVHVDMQNVYQAFCCELRCGYR